MEIVQDKLVPFWNNVKFKYVQKLHILIAESKPEQKEVMVKLIMNFINK